MHLLLHSALPSAVALAVALASAAPAQGFVSPPHFATVEGTGNSALPFGAATMPFRYQQVHDGVPAQALTGLAFRHDTTGTLRPAFSLTLDAWVSTAAGAAAATSATFDANHGPDKLRVVTNRTIVVPANDPARLPGAFLLDVPFDPGVVFAFAGGTVCWEVQITASTNTTASIPFDAALTQGSTPGSPGMVGTRAHTGCVASGRTQPLAIVPANSPVDWTAGVATQVVNASQLQANGVAVWVTGTNTTSWAGVPLPVAIPGSLGAPSGECTLRTDLALTTAAIASASGTAQLQQQFPVTTALHGYVLPTQLLGLDAAANPFGLTASNLVLQQLVAPYATDLGIRRVYAAGSLAATGTVDGNSPLVTWFR